MKNTVAILTKHKELHSPSAIAQRLEQGVSHSYLKDFIYGAIDGAVTTFAVVSGVAGAGLSSGVIIVLGVANLVADGFSMAASNFLGSRAEEQLLIAAREEEREHIELYPEGEREEVRQIFANKGFAADELESIVDVITSNNEQWVNTMLQDELGFSLEAPCAWRAAVTTFLAFVTVGFLPIFPFVFNGLFPSTISHPFLVSSILTGVAFFFVGAMKSRYVGQHWSFAGLETLGVGGLAAVFSYIFGALLKGVL